MWNPLSLYKAAAKRAENSWMWTQKRRTPRRVRKRERTHCADNEHVSGKRHVQVSWCMGNCRRRSNPRVPAMPNIMYLCAISGQVRAEKTVNKKHRPFVSGGKWSGVHAHWGAQRLKMRKASAEYNKTAGQRTPGLWQGEKEMWEPCNETFCLRAASADRARKTVSAALEMRN